jgi:hypothetical protein
MNWNKEILSHNFQTPPMLTNAVAATLRSATYGSRLFMYGGETINSITSELYMFQFNGMDQYASNASASSEYCTIGGWSGFCAKDATGPPDTSFCYRSKTSWIGRYGADNNTKNWIFVTFDVPVYATELQVRETLHVGFVLKVLLIDEYGQEHLVFNGTDGTIYCPFNFAVTFSQPTNYRVVAANITTLATQWASIDSIKLVGFEQLPYSTMPFTISLYNMNNIMAPDTGASAGEFVISKPPALQNAAATFSGNELYLYGGIMGAGIINNQMYKYSVQQNLWYILPLNGTLYPGARSSHQMTAIGNEIYLFGGYSDQQLIDERNLLWVYDITTLSWSQRLMNTSQLNPWTRTDTSFVPIPGTYKFAMFGGRTKANNTNDLWVYDTVANQWDPLFLNSPQCSACPLARYNAVTDIWQYQNNTYFIVQGGYNMDIGPLNDLWLFNFSQDSWIQIMNTPQGYTPQARFSHVGSVIFNYLVLFGGTTQQGYTNDFLYLDLSNAIIGNIQWKRKLVPSPREGFISFLNNNTLYIHGGRNDVRFFSDMWTYNLITKEWSPVEVYGAIPDGCAYHSAVQYSNSVFVYGGLGLYGPIQSLYEFNILNNHWNLIVPQNGVVPPGRFSHQAALYDRNMFICNGIGNGPLTDVWLYSISAQIWQQISVPTITNAQYQTGTVIGNTLFLFGGEQVNGGPNNYVYSLDLQHTKDYLDNITSLIPTWHLEWSPNSSHSRILLYPASASMVINSNQVLLLGGEVPLEPAVTSYNTKLLLYDVKTRQFTDYLSLSPGRSDSNMIMHGNSILIFGGVSRWGQLNDLWQISTADICNAQSNNSPCLQCSPGFWLSTATGTSKCEICPIGFYSSNFNSLQCSHCPSGFMSIQEGINSFEQCIPCASGYKNTNQSAICLPCNASEFCPLATSMPLSESSPASSFSFILPKNEKSRSYYSNMAVFIAVLCLIVVGVFIIFLIVVIHCLHPKLSKKLFIPLDIFSRCHSFKMNSPIFLRKTTLGGAFSILYMLSLIGLSLALFIPYMIDNYRDTRTLTPAISDLDKITASINVSLTIPSYLGDCSNMSSNIEISLSGWKAISNSILIQNMSSLQERSCSIIWSCNKCNMDRFETSVSIFFNERNAYTSVILWKVSVESAIPSLNSKGLYTDGKTTSIQKTIGNGTIVPTDSNTVFRGDIPTQIGFILFPTIFENNRGISSEPNTGYQVEFHSLKLGSVVDQATFHSSDGFKVVFLFIRSDNILRIYSSTRITIQSFLSSILGAIFGLYAFFSVTLIILEDIMKFIMQKVFKKTKEYEDGYVYFDGGVDSDITRARHSTDINSYIANEMRRAGKVQSVELQATDPQYYNEDTLQRVKYRRMQRKHAIIIPPIPESYYSNYEIDPADEDFSNS